MIAAFFRSLGILSKDGNTFGAKRSARWDELRAKHIRHNPICVACKANTDLDVHHIKPFHLHPELELDLNNLITLCRKHHFYIGHDPDYSGPKKPSWSLFNPNVTLDAKAYNNESC